MTNLLQACHCFSSLIKIVPLIWGTFDKLVGCHLSWVSIKVTDTLIWKCHDFTLDLLAILVKVKCLLTNLLKTCHSNSICSEIVPITWVITLCKTINNSISWILVKVTKFAILSTHNLALNLIAVFIKELLSISYLDKTSSHNALGIKVTPVLTISSVVTVENLGTSLIIVVLITIFIFTDRITKLNTILQEINVLAINFMSTCYKIASFIEVIPISIFILDKGIFSLITTSWIELSTIGITNKSCVSILIN